MFQSFWPKTIELDNKDVAVVAQSPLFGTKVAKNLQEFAPF